MDVSGLNIPVTTPGLYPLHQQACCNNFTKFSLPWEFGEIVGELLIVLSPKIPVHSDIPNFSKPISN